MASHALLPGTFDPPTVGHVDLIRRAHALFGRVTVLLASHPTKEPLFAVEERADLLRATVSELDDVDVLPFAGLVVQACEHVGADVIVRGVRSGSDLDYEVPMAHTNRAMLPRVDTLFLPPSPAVAHVSSTLVRQIAAMGGDATPFVPEPVADALRRRFPNDR